MFMLNYYRIPLHSYITDSQKSVVRTRVDTISENQDGSDMCSDSGLHMHSMVQSSSGDRTGSRATAGRWGRVASGVSLGQEYNNGF
jgi:hypothetical protein